MKKRFALCLMTLVVAVALGVGWDLSSGSPGPDFAEWVATHGAPIDTVDPDADTGDLVPLRRIVDDARVVCLGESRHDASEQFRLKHRMIRYLVEEMGFSVIVFEEGMACAKAVDDYLQGGAGDPAAILGDLSNWFAWDTQEVLELVAWMREYNDDPSHKTKLRFLGVDCTAPRLGVVNALAYIENIDPAFADRFEQELIHQGDQRRSISETIEVGWRLLESQRPEDLSRLDEAAWSWRRAQRDETS